MEVHLIAFFLLTTINSIADTFIFEDWSVLLVLSVVLKFIAIIISLFVIARSNEGGKDGELVNEDQPRRRLWLWKVLYVTPLLLNNIYWLNKMPFTWESDLWSVQVDFVVMIWVILSSPSSTLSSASSSPSSSSSLSLTVQDMYACYYTAAGFWKINTHFLDPTSSCATVFLCQHLTRVAQVVGLSWETQVQLAKIIAPTAPIGTIAVELSMGLGLVIGRVVSNHDQSRFWTRIGLRIILLFHLAVCVTPEPNDISLFALQCACRLVLLTNERACDHVGRRLLGLKARRSDVKNEDSPESPLPCGLALLWISCVSVAYGHQHRFTPLNWSFLLYIPVMVFLLLTLEYEGQQQMTYGGAVPVPNRRPVWMTIAFLVALCYSFGTIVLGTMEEASCNMFSNLKIHGGTGNHVLLPTGLLFKWFRDAGSTHPYSGGEIRIVSTTSNWLQEIYPNDLSHVLTPSTLASHLLTETTSMSTPTFLNPGANRVLGLREKGWVPPPPHGKFIPYSVPALEWKRLLKEAIEKDASFDVTYVHLPGSSGDEIWRGTAWERQIDLRFKNSGDIVKCKVKYNNGTKTNCQPSIELPYHLEVPWLVRKISMYHGYPILFEEDGKTPRRSIQCFGP
jgi:hypothetical protein